MKIAFSILISLLFLHQPKFIPYPILQEGIRVIRSSSEYSLIQLAQEILKIAKDKKCEFLVKITGNDIYYEYIYKGRFAKKERGVLSKDKQLIYKFLINGISKIKILPQIEERELILALRAIINNESFSAENIYFEKNWRESFGQLRNYGDDLKVINFFLDLLEKEAEEDKLIAASESLAMLFQFWDDELFKLSEDNLITFAEKGANLLNVISASQDEIVENLIEFSRPLVLHMLKRASNEFIDSISKVFQSLVNILKSELYPHHVRKRASFSLSLSYETAQERDFIEFLSLSLEKDIIAEVINFAQPNDVADVTKALIRAKKISLFEDYAEEIFACISSNINALSEVGQAILLSENQELIDRFIENIIRAEINLDDSTNVKILLNIISLNPYNSEKLINYITMHFLLTRHVLADDLSLLKTISYLLASDIRLVYFNLRTMLKNIPYSFGEIIYTDAEWGDIRSFSRRLDGPGGGSNVISHPGMRLFGYLRNQIHQFGQANTDITLVERILAFWLSEDKEWLRLQKEILRKPVPDEVVDNLPEEDLKVEGRKKALLILLTLPHPSEVYSSLREEIEEFLIDKKFFKAVSIFRKIRLNDKVIEELKKLDRVEAKMEPQKVINILKEIGITSQYIEEAKRMNIIDILEALWLVALYQGLVKKYDILESRLPDKIPESLIYQKDNKLSILEAAENLINIRDGIREEILSDMPVKPYESMGSDYISGQQFASYQEKRFDLFNYDRYLEIYAEKLFTDLIQNAIDEIRKAIDASYSIKLDFILDAIRLTIQNLRIDGLGSIELDHIATNLEYVRLSPQQILNITDQILAELDAIAQGIVFQYSNIAKIAALQIGPERLAPQYYDTSLSGDARCEKAAITAVADLRKTIFRLKALDILSNMIELLQTYLKNKIAFLPLTAFNSCRRIRGGNFPKVLFITDYGEKKFPPTALFGKKAVNLMILDREGLPIPIGFVISTEVIKDILNNPEDYKPGKSGDKFLRKLVAEYVVELEKRTGLRFGGDIHQPYLDKVRREKGIDTREQRKNPPIFFSCRSGSALTLPGILATTINVGIGASIEHVEKLVEQIKDPWAVWDGYRRFLQSFAIHVLGREKFLTKFIKETEYGPIEEEKLIFDKIIEDAKREAGVSSKDKLTSDEMRNVAIAYREVIKDRLTDEEFSLIENNPFEQLMSSIYATINSWNSELAIKFRKAEGIAQEWLTPVIIQVMKWGTFAEASGSGVLLTSSPHGGIIGIYKPKSQGSDIMLGVSAEYMPLSNFQRRGAEPTLESTMAGVYTKLSAIASKIEKIFGKVQEIEFVIEKGKIWLLQTRESRRIHVDLNEEGVSFSVEELKKVGFLFDKEGNIIQEPISFGIPNFSGRFMGHVAYDETTIIKAIETKSLKDYNFVLLYDDITPENLPEIWELKERLNGVGGNLFIISRRGGFLSHAIEVAGSIKIPALVKVDQLIFDSQTGIWQIGGNYLDDLDDILFIDNNGNIYLAPR